MKKLSVLIVLSIFFFLAVLVIRNYPRASHFPKPASTEVMNVIFAADKRFIDAVGVSITSLLLNNRDRYIHVFLLTNEEIPNNSKHKIKMLMNHFPYASISILQTNVPNEFQKIIQRETISVATYLRLYAADLLPKSIHKALYLDADTITHTSLSSFYDTPLQNAFALAISDIPYEQRQRHRLNSFHLKQYINAGVMLLNLEKIRAETSLTEITDFIRQQLNNPNITFGDQDIINILWQDKIVLGEHTYNVNMRLAQSKTPAILHYSGKIKPWHNPISVSLTFALQSMPWHLYNQLYHNYTRENNAFLYACWQSALDIYELIIPTVFGIKEAYIKHINQPLSQTLDGLFYRHPTRTSIFSY